MIYFHIYLSLHRIDFEKMPHKRKKSLFQKLKRKYRLIIYNDTTFEEVLNFRLSTMNVINVTVIFSILMVLLTTTIIAFTPLRQFIPGYPTESLHRKIVRNAVAVDSLRIELELRDKYLGNLRSIILGEEIKENQVISDSKTDYSKIEFSRSKEDSILRAQVEEEELYNLSSKAESNDLPSKFSDLQYFPPVKGIITDKFNPAANHNGVDIVAGKNEVIKATLDGTITLATWSPKTGNMICIQHSYNIVSVYKHVSSILKTEGQKVRAGDAIAIIGNTGEYSTGPHLHFELWKDGKPVNPEKFISF